MVAFLRGESKLSLFRMQGEKSECMKAGKLKNISDIKEKINHVCCGENNAILIVKGGNVLSLDRFNKLRPLLCDKRISQVACGNRHSLALSEDGQLFTWGQNSNGQLGLGKGESSKLSPQPLESLVGIPLSQISAGGDHSFALSLSGAVFGWGKNRTGQLGLGDNTDCHEPVQITSLNFKKTIHISCGEEHTAILTKDGMVFTCGSGRYGQLGHNSFRDEVRPRLVAELWGSKVSQIACGSYHTLALVEPSSAIFAFGCGDQGQLGNGQRTNSSVPLCVHIPPDHERTFGKIVAGGHLSFVFCKTQTDPATHNLWESKGLLTLDDQTIDRWVSESDTRKWKTIRKEIEKIFASASCINGSFIKTSSDRHYLTGMENSGLDLSHARHTFKELAKKHTVLTEVESVVEQKLLPTLSSCPAGVEGLRVYLILPELLRVLLKQQQGTDLAVSLAEAILRLHPNSLKALGRLWSSLSGSFIEALVKTFRSVSETLLDGIIENYSEPEAFLKIVTVLQRVYEATQRRKVPGNVFHIEQINNLLDARTFEVLESCPCVFDMEAKCAFFKRIAARIKTAQYSKFHLTLKRTTPIQSVLSQLRSSHPSEFRKALKVKFEEEDGEDYGGISCAFFNLITEAFFTEETKTLEIYSDSRLAWFRPETSTASSESLYLGMIFGMALYNDYTVHPTFPQALFKKLLGLKPTLEDLEELSPCEARGLKQLLDEDEDVIDLLNLDFTMKEHDLIPNGRDVIVTKANRKRYVDLYVDYVFNKSVTQQFEDFTKGFDIGCPCRTWKIFQPNELMNVLYGDMEYQWEELQKNAIYTCGSTDKTVEDFWEVFFEFSEENKKRFLSFVRGTDQLPVGGLAKLRLTVHKKVMDNADEHYPWSSTCFMSLTLPNYSTIDTLRKNLTHAINHCNEFGCH